MKASIRTEVKKLERLHKKLSTSYIRDYGGMPPLSAYFMSVPLPCWIKTVDVSYKTPRFTVAQTNYACLDAYGIDPGESYDEKKFWSDRESLAFSQSDLDVLYQNKSFVTVEHVFNRHLEKTEALSVFKWPISFGGTQAICGAVIDPTYIQELLERLTFTDRDDDYSNVPIRDLLAHMEDISNGIDVTRRKLNINYGLIHEFFVNSPVPMWTKQYLGPQSNPRKARFHLAQVSAGYHDLEAVNKKKKIIDLDKHDYDVQAALHRTIVEDGKLVEEADTSKTLRQINWPLMQNGELSMVAGVMLGKYK